MDLRKALRAMNCNDTSIPEDAIMMKLALLIQTKRDSDLEAIAHTLTMELAVQEAIDFNTVFNDTICELKKIRDGAQSGPYRG